MTAKAALLMSLPHESSRDWLGVHEINIGWHSQTAISARLRELAREGKVIGRVRKGKAVKEWARIIPTAPELDAVMATCPGSDPT